MTLKMVIFVLSQIHKMIICFAKSADFFVFLGFPDFKDIYSQLTVKAIFARLRKLQCFKAV